MICRGAALLSSLIIVFGGTAARIYGTEAAPEDNAAGQPAAEQPAAEQPAAAEVPAGADPSIVVTNGIPGWPAADDVFSDAAVLIDADTGTVLFDKSKDVPMYPASVTKLMTILLALENGNLEDQVVMTETGTAYCENGSSNLYTQVGEVFTLEQLLYGTMLKSANDMATQVGEYIGGTLDNFIQMMNDRALSLGCTGTHFENACGMPNDAHMTTAHDLARIAQQDLKYEKFRQIVNTATYTIPPTNMTPTERDMTNHNALLVVPDFYYPGIIGGKTGYTDAAQSCLSNFASRNGMTLIVITLHAMDGSYAAQDNVDLLNYGFDHFKLVDVGLPEYITSGGKVMIPSTANVNECRVEKAESVNAEGAEMVDWVYYYGDHRVGNMLMTKENADAYEKHLFIEAKKKEKAESKNKNKKTDDSSKTSVNEKKSESEGTGSGKTLSTESGPETENSPVPDHSEDESSHNNKVRSLEVKIIIGFVIFIIVFVVVMLGALTYGRRKNRRKR